MTNSPTYFLLLASWFVWLPQTRFYYTRPSVMLQQETHIPAIKME